MYGYGIEKIRTEPNSLSENVDSLLYFLYDLKYLTKPDALKLVLNQTDFLENLLSHLPKLYFLDKIE